jgi:hypothetical protein
MNTALIPSVRHDVKIFELGRWQRNRELLPGKPYGPIAASSIDLYDDYIPAIHRLALDRSSSDDAEGIEHIAAYLNFVVKNYVGRIPDKALNRSVAEKLFTMAEATRQLQSNIP